MMPESKREIACGWKAGSKDLKGARECGHFATEGTVG